MNRKELRRQKFGRGKTPQQQDTQRDSLIQEARDTLKIIQYWFYACQETLVELPDMPESVTILEDLNEPLSPVYEETEFKILRTDTLSALDGLTNPCALVFASGKKPGGGWLTGAKAQEEDICRCTALWAALKDSPMYEEHKRHMPGLYSDAMVYCPGVPIIKNKDGLLPEPKIAAFVASPAVNAGVAHVSSGILGQAMLRRMAKILRVMHKYGHSEIVLGSYGCGVFKNDIRHVAKWFVDLLHGPFKGCFKVVRFACIDPEHARVFCNTLWGPCFDKVENGRDLIQ